MDTACYTLPRGFVGIDLKAIAFDDVIKACGLGNTLADFADCHVGYVDGYKIN